MPLLVWILTSTDAGHHAAVRAHARGHDGTGVALAVLDTGLDADMAGRGRPHALFGRHGTGAADRAGPGLAGTRLLANQQIGQLPAEDQLGHGTAVAAIAAAERWNAAPETGRGHAPGAAVVGYAIADDASGLSEDATLIAAWQRVLEQRLEHQLLVACNAYSGSPDPTHPVQQALDACAWAGDVLVVVAAGNDGPDTQHSQAARNGLAVGAAQPEDKRLAPFSARGPLPGAAGGLYPDLVANGVAVRVPVPDDELRSAVLSGTSCAAAQVAGAAALLRARWPQLSAQQARAVLLASTEGVAARHSEALRAGLGRGYLRTDLAAEFPEHGTVRTVLLEAGRARPRLLCELPAGQRSVAVAVWPRTRLLTPALSVVELRVFEGTTLLAQATAAGGMHQRVEFVSASGRVVVELAGAPLAEPQLGVALAVGPAGPAYQPVQVAHLALGCPGSATAPGAAAVFPPEAARAFGNAVTAAPLALWPSRCQQVLPGALPPGELVGLAFRQDELTTGQAGFAVELEITLAVAARPRDQLATRFADNLAPGSTVVAFARRWLWLRDQPATAPEDPARFALVVPFDRPVPFALPPGQELVVDTRVFGNDQGNRIAPWWVDAADGIAAARVVGLGPLAVDGEVRSGFAAPLALLPRGSVRLVPTLEPAGLCERGAPCPLLLRQAAPGVLGLWLFGAEPAAVSLDGCTLGLRPEAVAALRTDEYGEARLVLPLPALPVPPPVVRVQVFLLDPAARATGIVLSELLTLRPGYLP